MKNRTIAALITFIVVFSLISLLCFLAENKVNGQQFGNFFDSLWWALITTSTTGYGDKVPVSVWGRILTIFIIMLGISGTSLFSASLASFFVDRNTKARSGLMDLSKMKDHLIICGWKESMKEIILEILNANPGLESGKIVLATNAEPEKFAELQEDPKLKNLYYVRGEYFSESTLLRAGVRNARKVLIVADIVESNAASETDSKTVMAVLTIKSITKEVYTCAEILDTKYEAYLKQAQCDEVLYSTELSKLLLASTTATSGLSHIMMELVTFGKSASKLSVYDVAKDNIGKTYQEYRKSLKHGGKKLLIGMLENTGSPNQMKLEALREAQKTSDVSKLILNLQMVKGLESNKPIFLPEEDYIIQPYSKAIMIEKL